MILIYSDVCLSRIAVMLPPTFTHRFKECTKKLWNLRLCRGCIYRLRIKNMSPRQMSSFQQRLYIHTVSRWIPLRLLPWWPYFQWTRLFSINQYHSKKLYLAWNEFNQVWRTDC